MVEPGGEAMRHIFKFYRRRQPPPDLGAVMDLREAAARHADTVHRVRLDTSGLDAEARQVGLQPAAHWRAYGLNGYPGFLFIVDPFVPGAQRFWARQCLKLYPQRPNVSNLDAHDPQHEDVWAAGMRADNKSPREPRSLLEKLRWVTLGYHYNWNTKRYSPRHRTCFPPELAALAAHVAGACGFPAFRAEAAIVNFYRADSALGPHVDEAELDLSQPLVSFSFGRSAVFLLGGLQRDDPALPLLVRSGDVMLMAGESRLRYHAVPRILGAFDGAALPACLGEPAGGGDAGADRGDAGATPGAVSAADWEVCARYLHESRVNVTVRQVAAEGQAVPDSEPRQHRDGNDNTPATAAATAAVAREGGYGDGDEHDDDSHRRSKEDGV